MIEIKEESEQAMVDDVFDVSQSGMMPFWLKHAFCKLMPSLATL